VTILTPARPTGRQDQRSFLLQRAQPAMNGLIDGSLSTLAPIFAVAFATHRPHYAFLAWIRWRFFATSFLSSFISIAIGGAIIAGVSAALGTIS
jgi:hypothetical protein